MTYHVYVSNAGSEWFSHFLMNGDTGRLEPQANIELTGTPGAATTPGPAFGRRPGKSGRLSPARPTEKGPGASGRTGNKNTLTSAPAKLTMRYTVSIIPYKEAT